MKTKWLEKSEKYDGSQLRPLFCYLEHGLLGNACVSWAGACEVSFDHMVDGEDLLQNAAIRGSEMVHFIAEIFETNLMSGVALQRLFANIVREVLVDMGAARAREILREGDDLYLDKNKLSISIATKSTNSVLIHFAVNISNKGTPVPTLSLQDLKVEPEGFARKVLAAFGSEFESIQTACWKVKPVP